jgi:hypothetical protein
MLFASPLPFREAIESRAVRQLLPTDFRTRLLSEIPAELRERAVFSAGVTNTEFLQQVSDSVDELLDGKTDKATKRAELKQLLARLEYRPVDGEQGSLTDLSSDRRLNLILNTNLQLAQGAGTFKQGQEPDVLAQWPAEEIIDTNPGQTENRRNWAQRWAELGGTFYGGRMIAKKGDPILTRISFFGLPYGPLALRSFWERQDVSADEALDLGVMTQAEIDALSPQSRDFNTDLQATPEVRDAALKEALIDSLGGIGQFIGGVLRFVGGAA